MPVRPIRMSPRAVTVSRYRKISTLATAVERLRTVADVAESGPVDPDSLDGELLPELLAEIRAMSPEQLRDQLAYEPDPARPPSTHPA